MSGAKIIQVSEDGVEWATLPGNTGDLNEEGNELTDTIFGQVFSSTQTGLINWSISANALYRGFAGYVSTVRATGEPAVFTDEEMSQVDSSQTWEIDSASTSVWSPETVPTFSDAGGPIDSEDIEEIDYLFGRVTFDAGFTPDGQVTVSGEYLPLAPYGRANGFTLTQSADTTGTTDFETAQQNGGFNTSRSTLLTADLELTAFYRSENDFAQRLQDRDFFVVEINPDGNGQSVARGFYKVTGASQSGDVGGDEESTVNLGLSVQEDITPFSWRHEPTTTMPQGLRIVQDAWANRTPVYVRYLPEGTNELGRQGQAFVTDTSISSGMVS